MLIFSFFLLTCIRNRCFGNGGFENNIKKETIKNEVLRKTKRNKRIARDKKSIFANGPFTIVTGRRRSGKTSLLIKAYEDVQDMLYFFVARKSEAALCKDFIEEMTNKLQLPILGEVTRFADIFKYLLQLSKIRPITLVIDEFQDFKRVNPSIFQICKRYGI